MRLDEEECWLEFGVDCCRKKEGEKKKKVRSVWLRQQTPLHTVKVFK